MSKERAENVGDKARNVDTCLISSVPRLAPNSTPVLHQERGTALAFVLPQAEP